LSVAFSNSPPVNIQWLQVVGGVTNNINTGVVNVTNNGVVTSTLTINGAPLADSGNAYQVEAINATNSAAAVYSSAASLTVVPTIKWYAPGAGNGVFSTDSVLGFAGTVANEVYGVDFGGSGAVTTGNGYTFNDYAASGNMRIANGSGLAFNTGFEGGSVTTGDNGLDTILDYGVTGPSTCTGTLNNLTVGQAYTVLVLMDDNRTSGAGGPDFDVTDGLTASSVQTYAFPNGTPAVGGFIMGTFIAQSTNQPLTVLEDGNAQYIAVLLEKGTAPAPVVAPTITHDVSPLVSKLSPGAPVTLSVVAAGSSPLSYQWSNSGGPISGATNATYSFDAPAGPDSYGTNTYYCTVTNALGSVVSSSAEVITSTNIVSVYNFSFEDDVASGPGGVVQAVPSNWTAYNQGAPTDFGSQWANGTDYTVYDPLAPPADANQYCYVNMFASGVTGGVYQDVGALKPNTTYTLTVAIGSRADRINSPGIISLINGHDNTGTLLASGGGLPPSQNTWQNYTITYSTGPSVSGDLTVELSVVGSGSIQADFDNVQLTQAPAPSVVAPALVTDISPLESRLSTGTPVTFTVSANGYPLDYQWYNQNGAISGATNASYSFNSLTGTNSYYVIVTNTAGATNSSTAVVISSPNIVTVNNYGFQNNVLGPGQTVILTPNGPSGWTGFNVGSGGNYDIGLSYANGGDFTDPLTAPASGNNYLWINRFNGNGSQVAGVYQDVGRLQANTIYTLTVAIGQRADTGPDGSWSPGMILLINGSDNTGTVLATGGGLPGTPDTWQDYTVACTTGASVNGDLTIVLSVLDAPSIQADFSNVQLAKAPLFIFNPPILSGTNLILTATGGTANNGYTLLTTTNLLVPWTTASTGTFNSTGVFSNSVPIQTGPARFFLLRTP
ncbi:MAG TPA: immunoglobulin domain-containing protein, partial [Candidatus Saccharimonadales bacterium]|nr:immunoglobulin domain-containing protein [Candidatus Saccharimonadales bacterium]